MNQKNRRNLIFAAILIGLTIVLLPFCFRSSKIIYDYALDSEIAVECNDTNESFATGSYTLSPGVYRVALETQNLPEDCMIAVTALCDTDRANFKSFKSNTAVLFQHQSFLDYEFYALDSVPGVHLQVDVYNGNVELIRALTIHKTNLGAIMLLAISYVVLAVIFLLFKLREGILACTISKSRQIAIGVVFVSTVISLFPYLNDYFSIGADSFFHLVRIESLKETILHGNQFPIRISDYWLYGHGYMDATFYGDLLLYIPAIMRIMGFPLGFAAKAYVVFVVIAMAFVTFHCIYRCTQNDYAAMIGSAAFLISPYLFHNIYNRGAVGEYTAMIFLPLVFTAIFLLYTEDVKSAEYKKYKWYLVVGMTLILQNHLITCEMTVALLAVFAVCEFKKTFRKETFLQLVQAALIVILVNCYFWLPLLHSMVTERFIFHTLSQQHLINGVQFAEFFQITSYKGAAQTGMYHAEALQPGFALLIALFVFAVTARKSEKTTLYVYCKKFFVTLVILMVLCTRYFPWNYVNKIPGVAFLANAIQFPYRILSPIVVLGAFFLGFMYLWMAEKFDRTKQMLFGGILLLTIFLPAVFQVNDIAYVTPPVRVYSGENIGSIFVSNAEYLLEGSTAELYKSHLPIAGDGVDYFDYEKKGTEVSMYVENSSEQDSYVDLPLIGYKGYVVNDPLSISEERGYNMDLRISIPANYTGELQVRYKERSLYLAADAVSLISILGVGNYLLFFGKRRNEDAAE